MVSSSRCLIGTTFNQVPDVFWINHVTFFFTLPPKNPKFPKNVEQISEKVFKTHQKWIESLKIFQKMSLKTHGETGSKRPQKVHLKIEYFSEILGKFADTKFRWNLPKMVCFELYWWNGTIFRWKLRNPAIKHVLGHKKFRTFEIGKISEISAKNGTYTSLKLQNYTILGFWLTISLY